MGHPQPTHQVSTPKKINPKINQTSSILISLFTSLPKSSPPQKKTNKKGLFELIAATLPTKEADYKYGTLCEAVEAKIASFSDVHGQKIFPELLYKMPSSAFSKFGANSQAKIVPCIVRTFGKDPIHV